MRRLVSAHALCLIVVVGARTTPTFIRTLLLLFVIGPAASDAAERIALVASLSGAERTYGRDQRDGFFLAVREGKGTLNGVPVNITVFDDEGKAKSAPAIARRIVALRAAIVVGLSSEESAVVLHRALEAQPVLLLSTRAAPRSLAGESCSPKFFSTAALDDAVHESAGAIAAARRYQSLHLLIDPAKTEQAASAFRRRYSGAVSMSALGGDAKSRAEAINEVLARRPDAIYVAASENGVIQFLRAYDAVGLLHRIPVITAPIRHDMLDKLAPHLAGVTVAARWVAEQEAEHAEDFVNAFRRYYRRTPSIEALQSYEAALLLGVALAARGDKGTASGSELAAALLNAEVDGVAGRLAFAQNGFLLTDWHAWEIFSDSRHRPYFVRRHTTLERYAGPDVARCIRR